MVALKGVVWQEIRESMQMGVWVGVWVDTRTVLKDKSEIKRSFATTSHIGHPPRARRETSLAALRIISYSLFSAMLCTSAP